MRRRLLACAACGVAVATIALLACGSFGGGSNSPPEPPVESGPPIDATDTDADADAPDGSQVSLALCAQSGFLLCDDFERNGLAGKFWTIRADAGVPLTIDSEFAASPTRSLKAVIPAVVDAAAQPHGYLTFPDAGGPSFYRVRFSLRAAADAPVVQVVHLGFQGGTFLMVEVIDGLVRLTEQDQPAGFKNSVDSARLVPGQWARFVFEVDLPGRRATLYRDDSSAVSLFITKTHKGPPGINVGALYAGSRTSPTTFYFDDVGLDVK